MGKKWLIFWLVGVWSFVGGLWWAHRGTRLPEHDHALPLETLIAKVDAPVADAQFKAFVDAATPADDVTCGGCHAGETRDWGASPHAVRGPDAGFPVDCAACHVRDGAIYGAGAGAAAAEDGAAEVTKSHATVAMPALLSPVPCAQCHEAARDGGASERSAETTDEWMRTDFAAQGKTCVTCHMPEGRHLWKGVHDKEMVASAITADVRFMTQGTEVAGKLTVTNTGAGHRLPTTAGAELVLVIDQLDGTALPIPGTHAEGVIGRRLDDASTIELFDTRLLPGESKILPYITGLHPDTRAFRARVECRPEGGGARGADGAGADATSAAQAGAANFTAWEEIVRLPAE